MQYLRHFFNMLMVPVRPVMNNLRKSMPVLLSILIILLLIAIWTYGEHWSFDQFSRHSTLDIKLMDYATFGTRLSLTAFIIVMITIYFTYKVLSKSMALKQEKAELEKTQEAQDETLPYVKDQEEILNMMAETLQERIGSKDFMYKLPWYLLVGASNSGKTSFINRSNQKFTLTEVERSAKRYQRRHSDYEVNWWASDEAIFIDPSGELFMQQQTDEDPKANITSALWLHLIQWINQVRPRRPVNGIVLVIDFPQLIGTSNSERKGMAVIMRGRIRELMEQFGARLPVYVVLNKFDLLEGFGIFYSDLEKTDRQRTLGFSFTLNTASHLDEWIEEFENYYTTYVEEIEEIVFDRLANTVSRQKRESLYMFVRELSGLKEILLQFLCDVLESDRFTTTPYVRGVYFSSVFQQGIPTDFYQAALSKQFNVPFSIPTVIPEREQRAYFSHDFFSRVIYPEAGLVTDNTKVTELLKRKRFSASILTTLITLGLLIGWQFYYTENHTAAEKVQRLVKEFDDLSKSEAIDYTGKNLIEPLNLLREATFEFGHYKDAWPIVEDLGLYQGGKIGRKLDEAYAKYLKERFLPSLALGLIHEMNQLPDSSDKGLETLRIYRMIDDMPNRRETMANKWMASYWQRHLPNDGMLQKQLMQHFAYAMKYVDPDLSAYNATIAQKQDAYRRIPLAERVYRNLKVSANTELSPPTNLRNEIGSAFDIVYQSEEPIMLDSDDKTLRPISVFEDESASMEGVILSPLFTNWAYKDYYVPKSDNIIELAMIDSWVLGQKEKIDYSEEDLKKLEETVRNLYLSDYINTWRQGINNLEINDFRDVAHAEQVLESIIGTAQPFQNLVRSVKKNSQIYPPIKETDTAVRNKLLNDPNRAAAMKVTNKFSALSNLISDDSETSSYIEEVMGYIQNLHAYLKSISSSVEPGKAALKAVKSELELEKISPIATLKRIATGTPAPFANQLNQIANNSWRVVLTAAIEELEQQWQEDVYNFYQVRIANKYPFNPNTNSMVSIDDFESFFGREGKLQTFYDTYLKLFLQDNKEVLTFEDTGSIVDPEFLNSLQEAWDIQDAFFDPSGKLSVKFTLKPLGLSGMYRASSMNIDGQIVKYSHGRSFASKLIWPNTIRDRVESKLTVVTGNGRSKVMRRSGAWSWFKILDTATIIARTEQSIDLQFAIGDSGSMKYRLTAEDTNNPFIREPFRYFSLPQTLLTQE